MTTSVDTKPASAATPIAAGADGWPHPRTAWYMVGVLAVAQCINAIDRHIINLLVPFIKADLQISDTQMGLLLGFAFALFYTVMGLPIGRWADSYSRRIIIAFGAGFWSLMTIACGLAQNFLQLFLARMGVGAGEATLNPSGYSLISDYFPQERRAKPLGVFIMGHTVGAAIALLVGGALVQYLVSNEVTWTVPLIGTLQPWQIAFVCAGAPGFLIVLLILTIREPERREMMAPTAKAGTADAKPAASIPVAEVVGYFVTNSRVYLPIFLGFGFILLWEMGKSLWTPTYFIRTFGWTPGEVGFRLGLMTLFFTSGGAVASGWVSDYLAKRGYRDASLRAAFLGTLAGLPFTVLATLMPTPTLAVIMFCPVLFFGAFPFALGPAAIAAITPNQMRAQITALYLFSINLLGFGLGPLFIGAITDYVFADEAQLRYSISVSAAIAMPLALVALAASMRQYIATLERLESAVTSVHDTNN